MAKLSFKSMTGRLRRGASCGFSLVEMLVSVAILVIILGVIFGLTQQTAKVYKSTGGQIEAFRSARNAFETMTRNLSLATLNNYYDYVDASTGKTRADFIRDGSNLSSFNPSTYARTSDMHFVSGWYTKTSGLYSNQITHSVFFQAPRGYTSTTSFSSLENLVNACGYYIEYKSDSGQPNFVSTTPVYRYRLMEFIQPSESLTVYTQSGTGWFTTALDPTLTPSPPVHQLAPNIIALIINPKSSSADASSLGAGDPIGSKITDFQYNSRTNTSPTIHNQLPPILEIVMVAIDEASAARLLPNTSTPPTVIQTALTTNSRFQILANLDSDLADLGADLSKNKITYRVFRTLVPLRNSKWSNEK